MATGAIFNYGQTFFLDPASVGNSTAAGITSVNLYFQARPNFQDNQTGTMFPGISLYLTGTAFGIPQVTPRTFLQVARAEWNQISTSSDGTQPTNFRFPNPIFIPTGFSYAFLVSYDNNEQFVSWMDRTGNFLVGTQTPSPGPSSPINGQYYEFVNSGTLDQLEAATTQSDYLNWWNPLNNAWLKFDINAARYYVNGVPVFANTANVSVNTFIGSSGINQLWDNVNTVSLQYPANRMEAVTYNRSQSLQQAFIGGQRVWQNTVFYPAGSKNFATVSCNMSNTITANSQTSNGQTFSWNTAFNSYQGQIFLAIFDVSGVNIRQVLSVVSNTVIIVDEPTTFVNSASQFMIAPVATIDSLTTASPGGNKTSLVFLRDSSANSTCRFTSCSIDPTTTNIIAGGTGYSNSDVLYFIGYEFLNNKIPAFPTYSVGNHWAVANLTTNSTGGITSLSFSNIGAGFVNASAVVPVFANGANTNPLTNTSAGTGANVVANVSSIICTELSNNVFRACNVVNLPLHYANPFWSMVVPNEVNTQIGISLSYFANTDAAANGGLVYYVSSSAQNILLTMNQINRFNLMNQPIPAFVSHSNEYIVLQTNGSTQAVNALSLTSNGYTVTINTQSTNDWATLSINTIPMIEFAEYIVNNDYTNENTNYGNAYAKHVTTKFTFIGNTQVTNLSEDLRVYLHCYRPPATDIEVYARIENSIDNEDFESEDWSRMVIVQGANLFSSPTQITDYVDIGYGFPGQPNSSLTITGVVTTTNNSSNIVGVNTTFQTQISNNSLIKLYDPLFPNNNFLVASVLTVTDNTHLTIDQNLSTNSAAGVGGFSLVGVNGLHIDVLNFSHQAFNNIWNQNVVRYYNASQHIYDGFNELQIKVVLLTSDQHQIPRINSIRGIAVSA